MEGIVDTLQKISLTDEKPKRGRPKSLKCRGVRTGGDPCPLKLKYSIETSHLFVNGSKTQCKTCNAAYIRQFRLNKKIANNPITIN